MDKLFELDNISVEQEEDKNRYTLSFSDGENKETITLSGKGTVKEPIKL